MVEEEYKGSKASVELMVLKLRVRKGDKKVLVRYDKGGNKLRPSDIVVLGDGVTGYECEIPMSYGKYVLKDYEVSRGVLGNVLTIVLKYG